MSIFVDTSAFFALLDRRDSNNRRARRSFEHLSGSEETWITSNYIILETTALLQNRLGMEAVRDFHASLLPMAEVVWITPEIHQAATAAVFTAARRKLSLVDCSSFELMRQLNLSTAFAFDRHFVEEGFELA